jgi:hypothetical protein
VVKTEAVSMLLKLVIEYWTKRLFDMVLYDIEILDLVVSQVFTSNYKTIPHLHCYLPRRADMVKRTEKEGLYRFGGYIVPKLRFRTCS